MDRRITGIMDFQHLRAHLTVSVSAIRVASQSSTLQLLVEAEAVEGPGSNW